MNIKYVLVYHSKWSVAVAAAAAAAHVSHLLSVRWASSPSESCFVAGADSSVQSCMRGILLHLTLISSLLCLFRTCCHLYILYYYVDRNAPAGHGTTLMAIEGKEKKHKKNTFQLSRMNDFPLRNSTDYIVLSLPCSTIFYRVRVRMEEQKYVEEFMSCELRVS